MSFRVLLHWSADPISSLALLSNAWRNSGASPCGGQRQHPLFQIGTVIPCEAVGHRDGLRVGASYPADDFTASAERKLEQALTTAHVPHDIKLYPNAKHSFFNEHGASYDPAASADAWNRISAFFAERIG
jgi:acetyl esterase/lipase